MTKKETHGSSETRKLLLNNDLLSDLIMESMSRQNSRITLNRMGTRLHLFRVADDYSPWRVVTSGASPDTVTPPDTAAYS